MIAEHMLGMAGVFLAGSLLPGVLLLACRRARVGVSAAGDAREHDFAEVAADWFWEIDAEHRFTFISDRFAAATGIPAGAFVGRKPSELNGIRLMATGTGAIRESIAARKGFSGVVQRIEFSDGRMRFWRVSAKPFFDPVTGAFAGYRGSGSDVTESVESEIKLTAALSRAKAAEEQSSRDRARLLEIIEVMPAGLALWDRDDRLVICNARYREIYKVMADEIVPGVRFEDLIRRSTARGQGASGGADIETWVAKRVASHRAPEGAFVHRRDDGRWLQVEERLTADGGVVGAHSDVTQLTLARGRAEAAEREARRDRARLIDAIDAIPTALALWDAQDRLVLCNARYREIYPLVADIAVPGVSFEEVIKTAAVRDGKSLADPDVGRWISKHLAMRQLARYSAPGAARHEQNLPDGRWVAVDDRPTSDGGVVAVRADITEERKRAASEREREKLAALGHLAGGVAHEINNLLQPAVTFPELVAERLPEADVESREDLATILDSARRARDIVKNILRFARREELALAPVDAVAEIKSVLAFVRTLAPSTVAIEESFAGAPADAKVSVNKTQLTQVITNLVVNAAQAMQDRGTITIGVRAWHPTRAEAEQLEIEARTSYIVISVADTGCGMDAATQARIFEPFFTTKSVGCGTGLGLSVVYGILRSWNGAITVASEPGHGATFSLYIPMLGAESRSEAA